MRRRGLFRNKRGIEIPLLDNLWKLEETSGITVIDSIGEKNAINVNGTLIGQAGKFGRAYSFDGVNDYLDFSVLNPDFSGSFSVGMWAKSSSPKDFMRLISTRDNSPNNGVGSGFALFANHSDTYLIVGNGNKIGLGSTGVSADWSLYFIGWDIETGRAFLYHNANKNTSVTLPQYIGLSVGGDRSAQVSTPSGSFKGEIDEIMFLNRAITYEEYLSIWNNGNGVTL